MKFKKGNAIIELTDPNTFSLAKRSGFEPVERKPEEPDDELFVLREKAKELGIKNTHVMGKERLLKEIAEKGE
jgi:hypothetical protein